MKVKVTFPGEHVEFDVKDVPELLRLCENARPFEERGYGSAKTRTYIEAPITMELPVTSKAVDARLVEPAPPAEPGEPEPAPFE